MALIDAMTHIATRVLTLHHPRYFEDLTPKQTAQLCAAFDIETGANQAETVENILTARISESRRLGHVSRAIVRVSRLNNCAPEKVTRVQYDAFLKSREGKKDARLAKNEKVQSAVTELFSQAAAATKSHVKAVKVASAKAQK